MRTPCCFLTGLVFVSLGSHPITQSSTPHTSICHCHPGEQLYSIQPEINRHGHHTRDDGWPAIPNAVPSPWCPALTEPLGTDAVGAWRPKHINLGSLECLSYPRSSLALFRENEGIWDKALLLHGTVVKLQIKCPYRNMR